jgi:hypothetical protein
MAYWEVVLSRDWLCTLTAMRSQYILDVLTSALYGLIKPAVVPFHLVTTGDLVLEDRLKSSRSLAFGKTVSI